MPKKSNKNRGKAEPSRDDSEEAAKINHLLIDRIMDECQTGTGRGMSTSAFIALVLAAFNGGPVGREMNEGNGYPYFWQRIDSYRNEQIPILKEKIQNEVNAFSVLFPFELRDNKVLYKKLMDTIKNTKGVEVLKLDESIIELLKSIHASKIDKLRDQLKTLDSLRNSEKVKKLKQEKIQEIELRISTQSSIDYVKAQELGHRIHNMQEEWKKMYSDPPNRFINVMHNLIGFIYAFNEVQFLAQADRNELELLIDELAAIDPDETVHRVLRHAFYDYTVNLHHRVGTAYLNQDHNPTQAATSGPVSASLPESAAEMHHCELCHEKPGDGAAKLKKCKCRQVRYCSSKCQMQDWPKHKQTCLWYNGEVDLRHQDEGGEGPAARGPVRRHAPELDEEDDCVDSGSAGIVEEVD